MNTKIKGWLSGAAVTALAVTGVGVAATVASAESDHHQEVSWATTVSTDQGKPSSGSAAIWPQTLANG